MLERKPTLLVIDEGERLIDGLTAYVARAGFRALRTRDGDHDVLVIVPAAARGRSRHDVIRVGGLTVDRWAHEVTRDGQPIKLTPTEYRLLGVFVDHPGQVFTRDHLIALVSHGGGEVFERTLDRHVANLRAKIEVDAQHPGFILTVYGVGYKLAKCGAA
jgi:DNA-binding response OmpR family regulator